MNLVKYYSYWYCTHSTTDAIGLQTRLREEKGVGMAAFYMMKIEGFRGDWLSWIWGWQRGVGIAAFDMMKIGVTVFDMMKKQRYNGSCFWYSRDSRGGCLLYDKNHRGIGWLFFIWLKHRGVRMVMFIWWRHSYVGMVVFDMEQRCRDGYFYMMKAHIFRGGCLCNCAEG